MKLWKPVVLILVVAGWLLPQSAGTASVDKELWKAQDASENCNAEERRISIGGMVLEGFIGLPNRGSGEEQQGFAAWRVPEGYSAFECHCGVDDTLLIEKPASFDILLNGDPIKSFKVASNEKPVDVSIPVSGGQSVRITFCSVGGAAVVAEPKFTKAAAKQGTQPPSRTAAQVSAKPAPFAVDPRDLDTLALQLRQACDKNATAKERMGTARVAIATFLRIDIDSESVARNVAEDLYGAMSNKGRFQLVERGQLDNILRELKIHDTTLIDQQTALKLGRDVRLKGADVILVGSISDRGAFVVINARLIDLKTGVHVAAQRVEMRKIPIERAFAPPGGLFSSTEAGISVTTTEECRPETVGKQDASEGQGVRRETV